MFSQQVHDARILIPWVQCSSCGTHQSLIAEHWRAGICSYRSWQQPIASKEGPINGPVMLAPAGFPETEAEAFRLACDLGWIVETVHGKQMLFCPECRKR